MLGGGICDLAAYEPASLKDASGNKLYQFSSIDFSWYSGWLNNASGYHYWNWYCNKTQVSCPHCSGWHYINPDKAILESMCPSAMVDNSGVLYTINFYTFSYFQIAKYTPSANGRSITKTRELYYLYNEVAKAHGQSAPGYHPTGPYTNASDIFWTKFLSHNILSPTIAQEVQTGNSDYIYICFLNPPQRWLNNVEYASTEGLAMAKIRKTDLSLSGIKCVANYKLYGGVTSCASWPARTTHWGHLFQPEWGPCKAAFDGAWVHCFQIGYPSHIGSSDGELSATQGLHYKKISASGFYVNSYSTVGDMFNRDINQSLMFPRFQKVDSNTYFCTSNGGGFCLGRWGTGTPTRIINSSYQDHVQSTATHSPGARYSSDFCILKNGSQHVACFLGLKATGYNSDLSATYGWSNSGSTPSINWNPQHLACILYSYPVSGSLTNIPCSLNLKTSPSNVIYNTQITRANGDAVNIANISAADSKRLYLNTQNIVPYTSASGRNYIIYAYCYPGKTKQLYLGYAQYSIDAENHIHLMTKREFRDKSGNSFGNFTDCSRIISMDLKNGHLWITFIRGDSNGYYCFHILAKDLVGE